MNDNDIIKALEIILGELCEVCACEDEDSGTVCVSGCTFYVVKVALNLINRQKAEIERLETENKEQDQAIINALHRMGQIRAEAIKEFAERLKRRHLRLRPCFGIVRCCLSETDIDNLVKEMTEVPE